MGAVEQEAGVPDGHADAESVHCDLDDAGSAPASDAESRRVGDVWASWDRVAITRIVWAIALPLVFFLVLRPERYSVLPNGLDPMFYTGYAINFDDMLPAIEGGYYFVTRWPAYLPSRFASDVFGPSLGRLVLRWAVATAMLLSLWNLGRRSSWNRPTQFAVALVALSSPMFVRSFLSDYPEWLFSSFGVILISECLAVRRSWQRSLLIGGLIAAMVISNPFAVIIAGPPTVYYALRRPIELRSAASRMVLVAGGCVAVTLAGYVWFEWRYGFNPYSSTIDFLTNRTSQRDRLKSPRFTWMVSFTWIYIPAMLLLVLAVPAIRRWARSVGGFIPATAFLAIQYSWQIADQFVRDGNGLEISYYWIAIYPSVAVLGALTVGAISWTWRTCVLFLAAWMSVLVVSAASDVRLPAGWPLVAIGVVAVLIATALIRSRHPAWLVAMVTLLGLVAQSLAPEYDPSAYHPYNMDPQYDNVIFSWHTEGTRMFEDAVWLESVLDTIPDDSDVYFVAGDGGGTLPAIYGAHVTGRVLSFAGGGPFDDGTAQLLIEFSQSGPHVVALFGTAEWVQDAVEEVRALPVAFDLVLDEAHERGNGVGVIVGVLDALPVSSGSWTAAELRSQTGQLVGSEVHGRAGEHSPGFLVFGPYVRTIDGPLRATLTYRSSAAASDSDAVFDVTVDGGTQQSLVLPGTGGAEGSAAIEFEGVEQGSTEFRVIWSGGEDFDVLQIRLD